MNNIYLQFLDIKPESFPLVLATVTKSVGSTPQKPGSSALFNSTGLLTGTVGGGVLEGVVQKIAIEAVQSKKSGLYDFKLDTEIHNGIGTICGGQAGILVDASPEDSSRVFEQIRESIRKRIAGVLVTSVGNISQENARIQRYWLTEPETEINTLNLDFKMARQSVVYYRIEIIPDSKN